MLLAIALDEGQGIFRADTRRRHRLGPAARVQKSVRRLVERELVEGGADAGYRVPDVFLRAWLRRLLRQHGLPALPMA